jgi:hypothetical protein
MEHPIGSRLVLPLPRLQQIPHDRYRSGTTHAFGRLCSWRETEHLVATGCENLDQLSADESGGSRDKYGRARVACHVASLERAPTGDHRQDPYETRTTLVQAQR